MNYKGIMVFLKLKGNFFILYFFRQAQDKRLRMYR